MTASFALGAARLMPWVLAAVGLCGCGAGAADAGNFGSLESPGLDNPLLVPTVSLTDYFSNWENRVKYAQSTQPHWMTPLVTVTPRLEQEVRYDQYFEHAGNGADVTTFDSGKGLEFIPTTTNEVLVNAPAWERRTIVKPASGFTDWPFLVVKQRLLSAPEDKGNYIVTGFLGVTAPIGAPVFTNGAYVITPTIAGGKGFGDFDIQATMGTAVPLQYESVIGTSLVTNVALQYHIFEYFWPELEFNDTYWFDGTRGGLNQLFITPGVILGRFGLGGTAKFIIGIGYQVAVDPSPTILKPSLTPTYDHAVLVSTRMAF